jgi:hypothetical protein
MLETIYMNVYPLNWGWVKTDKILKHLLNSYFRVDYQGFDTDDTEQTIRVTTQGFEHCSYNQPLGWARALASCLLLLS